MTTYFASLGALVNSSPRNLLSRLRAQAPQVKPHPGLESTLTFLECSTSLDLFAANHFYYGPSFSVNSLVSSSSGLCQNYAQLKTKTLESPFYFLPPLVISAFRCESWPFKWLHTTPESMNIPHFPLILPLHSFLLPSPFLPFLLSSTLTLPISSPLFWPWKISLPPCGAACRLLKMKLLH